MQQQQQQQQKKRKMKQSTHDHKHGVALFRFFFSHLQSQLASTGEKKRKGKEGQCFKLSYFLRFKRMC